MDIIIHPYKTLELKETIQSLGSSFSRFLLTVTCIFPTPGAKVSTMRRGEACIISPFLGTWDCKDSNMTEQLCTPSYISWVQRCLSSSKLLKCFENQVFVSLLILVWPKISFRFSLTSYGKIQTNLLVNPVLVTIHSLQHGSQLKSLVKGTLHLDFSFYL